MLLLLLLLGAAIALLITAYTLLIIFSPEATPTTPNERLYASATTTEAPLSPLSDPPSCSLSVVVPAYNERERLPSMIDEAMRYLLLPRQKTDDDEEFQAWYGRGVEILIVDDGSGDDTAHVGLELANKWEREARGRVEIRVVRLEGNRGKGGAVRHGILFSRGERILFADADGASTFEDLALLQREMDRLVRPTAGAQKNPGHAVVVGSRAHMVNSDAVVKRSFLRNLLMRAFHIFLRTLGVRGVKDTQCGFKLFTRPTALTLFPTMHLHRWSFDVELLLLAQQLGLPIAEVPIRWHEVEGSKISVGWDGLGMARDLVVLRGNLALGRWVVPRVVGAKEE
ncbi:hypothetical protein QFC20_000458 [Naganishia adeliensis]|uniref:Uncharacterized protein n=1 Tax=Naganishia adeliensis TaxID=92952 RepID=A0ACC2X2M6_9TREE|nr:hypothetical protein QFC20_000458 [Naganishia adeliensis]